MKKTELVLLVLMAFIWTGCHKDKDLDGKDPVVSNEEIMVSGTQARFSWCVDFSGQFQTSVEVSQNENMTDVRRVEASKEDDKFVAVVNGLSTGTKYYYRIVIWNKFNNYDEEVKSFTTSQMFTVTLVCLPEEGGSVTGDGAYATGDTCIVVATANAGFGFVNWTENGNQISDEAEYSFKVAGDRHLVANFSSQEYTIFATADPEEGGTVTGSGGYNYGDECTLKATANQGFTFVNWTENGEQVSSNADYSFTVNGNRSLVAHFISQDYVIHVDIDPENGGTVTGAQGYNYGDECTLRATANEGYNFVNWTKDGTVVSTNHDYTFTVTGSVTFVAHFQALNYHITVSAEPSYCGTVSGGGDFHYGEECTVSASAEAGYAFSMWTEDGNVVSTEASYSFIVNGDRDLVANFSTDTYTIEVSANPSNGGNVTGGGIYDYGQSCTVTATMALGYTFNGWTENGTQVSTNASYTFTVTGNRTLVAQFQAQSYTINVSANPENGGEVSGGGTYDYGQSCTVIATEVNGFSFTNWTEDGNVVSNSANYTFSVNRGRTLVANFTPLVPTGAINGWFTINSNHDQVYFSQGNLQYNAAQSKWRFATNQWDYVGGTFNGQEFGTVYENGVKCDNALISPSYSGWIDLFGWGTSGWNSGNTYYHPWDTNNSSGLLYGPSGLHDLTGTYANADWGVYNAISNGGNQAGLWRTLTTDEWEYVFNGREGARYAKAKIVNGDININGVVLLPDHWDENTFHLNYINYLNATFDSNPITVSQWTVLEQAGAVFLPVTGYRNGVNLNAELGNAGHYWSASSHNDSDKAFNISFSFAYLQKDYYYRFAGESVRLVCPVEPVDK